MNVKMPICVYCKKRYPKSWYENGNELCRNCAKIYFDSYYIWIIKEAKQGATGIDGYFRDCREVSPLSTINFLKTTFPNFQLTYCEYCYSLNWTPEQKKELAKVNINM